MTCCILWSFFPTKIFRFGNVENHNKVLPCWTITELQGPWVYFGIYVIPNIQNAINLCSAYFTIKPEIAWNFTNKVSGEQKLKEIDKRIASVVPESTSQPRFPNDSLRAIVEQLSTTESRGFIQIEKYLQRNTLNISPIIYFIKKKMGLGALKDSKPSVIWCVYSCVYHAYNTQEVKFSTKSITDILEFGPTKKLVILNKWSIL